MLNYGTSGYLMEPLDGQSKTISNLHHEEGNFHASNFAELHLPTSLLPGILVIESQVMLYQNY